MLGSRVRAPKGALKMEIRNGLHFLFIPGLVRTKTFSTHVTPEICHDVRKSGVYTHGKNSHDGVGCIKTSLRLLTSPAGVEPLEVRFAHPVRLAPDTHSQGHGRPCLQRLHPRRAFPATWFIFCDSFWIFIWYRLKRFPRTKHIFKASLYRLKRFLGTKSETDTSTSPFSGFRARETGGGGKEKKPGHGKTATAACVLKRFPRTSRPKFIMTCVNRAFSRTRKSARKHHLNPDGLTNQSI